MHVGMRRLRLVPIAAVTLGAISFASAGCMQYAPDGSVVTPPPPGQSDSSRLPQLLSQLQGGGAGVEVFDGQQSEVLAAQDEPGTPTPIPGKDAGPPATSTVAGERTPNSATPATATPTRTATPTGTASPANEGQTPTPKPTSTPTPTATPSPTSTPTPTPTPSPTPVLPQTEAGATSIATPPPEG